MQVIILKSNFGTRFRFGEALGAYTEDESNSTKTTSEYLHSDTLWSALVNAWALACTDTVECFIDECRKGNFKLSSAFYCIEFSDRYYGLSTQSPETKKKVFFLPKPVSLNLFAFDEPKKLKRIKFISKGIWESGLLPKDWFNADKCTLLQNESIVALKTEIGRSVNIFKIETMPHTRARDVTDREDAFYYQSDLCLLHSDSFNVNWYFFVENNLPQNLRTDFKSAMQMLVNMGIGGERTSGCGSLTGYIEENYELQITNYDHSVSVSLIAPNENELAETSLYQVIKRGGRFLEKGKSLKMIQMLQEGAVFENDIKGKIVTLNENPPVLRYGINLSIPLHNDFINNLL
jgi:CRISPR-associated protein Csm4